MKAMIGILIIMILVLGCAQSNVEKTQQGETQQEVQEEVQQEEPQVEETQEEPLVETCEDKASKLVPETLDLTLANSHDPDTGEWNFDGQPEWLDGIPIDTKGDISFRKGRLSGENTNYWYTDNTQNEKLFGPGGLKYSKKVTLSDGTVGTNTFILKVVLKPKSINLNPEPFMPYTGTFSIIEKNFEECEFIS